MRCTTAAVRRLQKKLSLFRPSFYPWSEPQKRVIELSEAISYPQRVIMDLDCTSTTTTTVIPRETLSDYGGLGDGEGEREREGMT